MDAAKNSVQGGKEATEVDIDETLAVKKDPRTPRKWFCWLFSNQLFLLGWLFMWTMIVMGWCEGRSKYIWKMPTCTENTYKEDGFRLD